MAPGLRRSQSSGPAAHPLPAEPPPPGWYRDPAGSVLLRWWDGAAWTSWTLWPWSPPWPGAKAVSLVALWLATPAGSLLAAGAAAVMAVGWGTSVVVFVLTAASGMPGSIAGWLSATASWVLPGFDAAVFLLTLSARPGRYRRARPVGPRRPARRANRRAERASAIAGSRMARALVHVRGTASVLSGARLLTSLPRPIGPAVVAAAWCSLLAYAVTEAWAGTQLFRTVLLDRTLAGQLSAVSFWMMHLSVWCGLACRQLNRNRLAARMGAPESADDDVSERTDR